MKILMITDNDPAGMGIAFCNAVNRYSGHTCRLITRDIRYNFMFEKDLHLPYLDSDGWDEVAELLKKSDVFHFHMTSDEYTDLGPLRPVDFITGKMVVHHHHGHPDFRGNPEKYRQKYRERGRRNLLVSTPDLLRLLPEARWIPNIVPVFDERFMPQERPADKTVRVCQSPTRKELKNTLDLIETMDEVSKTHPQAETVIIENTAYDTCLSIKRSCDIHFDHMQGYFGVSSLESLSQGKPVIAGLDDWNIACIKEFTGADALPWVCARNRDQLKPCLESLIDDRAERLEIGRRSRTFMEQAWTEKHVVEHLISTYNRS
ncbi:glycosyltransferase family 4 protein [Desulfatiferula olefinivorans]